MAKKSYSNNSIALQKFKSNFWGVLSFCIIVFFILLAIFAYVFIPDKSTNANTADLSIHSKSPGFEVNMIILPKQTTTTLQNWFFGTQEHRTQIPIQSYRLADNGIYFTPYAEIADPLNNEFIALDQYNNDEISSFIKNKKFILGTDNQGRDYFSRLILGARVSLAIGFVAVFISLIIGITLGALAGYYKGKIDTIILWIINIFWSIPTLLLVIAITLALGKGFWQVFIAVGLTMWVEVARVVRGQVITVQEQGYVKAAKALGYSNARIILKHILPNCLGPVIVISAANFASAILMESGLSFLGLGTQVPTPSWGAMIKENYNYILLGKSYLALLPGLGMFLLVISFMLLGNALRDALDVKS